MSARKKLGGPYMRTQSDLRINGKVLSEDAHRIVREKEITMTEWARRCLAMGAFLNDRDIYIKEDGELVKLVLL